HDPARTLARAAAPLLGRSLRWGAWGQVLALGLTAATNAGAADDVAYFEDEEKTRKRATGLLLGLGGGGLGAVGAITFLGKGGSVFSAQTAALAAVTTAVVTATAIIGVHLADPGAAQPPPTVITPVAAQPRLPVTGRPPAGTVRQSQAGPGQGAVRDDPGQGGTRDQGRDPRDPSDPRDRVTPRPGVPRLTLSDHSIESGDSVDARATGFEPGEKVTFSWAGPGGGGDLGVRTAGDKGVAVLSDAVPDGIAAGEYTITAQGKDPGRRGSATLTVRDRPAPQIRFTRVPSSVVAEAAFEVVATGFDAGETVRLTLGDTLVATATAGGSGEVTLRGQAPAHPQTYTLTVTGRDGDRSDREQLTVTPKPPPDLSGNWGGYLDFRDLGGGFYEGTRYGSDWVEPNSGCTYPAGSAEVHLSGQSPTYEGEIRWIYGSNGQNCEFEWGAATFTLSEDGDGLVVRSEDPRNPGQRMSQTLRRN
ncbi:hypothetical protein, partial [Nonomuraea sp. NPDC050643]|uniref:hypothetical protein n=1 Tax=Nonomuraea sp. NPDC050643 TaxID=3155660 RepID=UPI0033E8E726